jgi:hypothetical protein
MAYLTSIMALATPVASAPRHSAATLEAQGAGEDSDGMLKGTGSKAM